MDAAGSDAVAAAGSRDDARSVQEAGDSMEGAEAASGPDAVVVCVGTSHPGNAGAVARVAANFGIRDLRFVAPRCDVRSEEALARAVHARDNLAKALVVDTLEEALRGTSLSVATSARQTTAENRFLRKPMDVRDWAEGIRTFGGTVALVFGREDFGLNSEEVNLCDQLVTIPTSDYASLNLAQAAGLLCYELFRARAPSLTTQRVLAPDTLSAMHKAWDDIVDCTEGRPWRKEVARGIWRKMVGRSQPDDHEVHNIMGILGNVLKRFDHPDWATAGSKRTVEARGLRAVRVDEEE